MGAYIIQILDEKTNTWRFYATNEKEEWAKIDSDDYNRKIPNYKFRVEPNEDRKKRLGLKE